MQLTENQYQHKHGVPIFGHSHCPEMDSSAWRGSTWWV